MDIRYLKDKILNWYYSKKYPWFKDWYWCFPKGWFNAFGKMMLYDIDTYLKMYNCKIHIEEIKEKYGELRFYCAVTYNDKDYLDELTDSEYECLDSCTEAIEETIDIYSFISKYTCMHCGKLNTPMLNIGGYVMPLCKKCFDKADISITKPYEELISDKSEIPNTIKETFIVDGNKMNIDINIDYYVNRIKKGRWLGA